MVVDTSSLIKSREDAFKTERTCCFMENSTELTIALESDKENIIRRMLDEKSLVTKPIKNLYNKGYRDKCILENNYKNFNIETNKIFTVISEIKFWLFAGVFGSLRQGLIGWLYSEKPIFEMNFHIPVFNEKEVVDLSRKMYVVLISINQI